jgi:hypothetical protein
VQVHYDEGVAIHIGPEPCVGVREDGDEASVGEGIGQAASQWSAALIGGSENRRPSTFWASPSSAEQAAADNSRSNGKLDATACGRSSRKLRRRCDSDGITQSPNKDIG